MIRTRKWKLIETLKEFDSILSPLPNSHIWGLEKKLGEAMSTNMHVWVYWDENNGRVVTRLTNKEWFATKLDVYKKGQLVVHEAWYVVHQHFCLRGL